MQDAYYVKSFHCLFYGYNELRWVAVRLLDFKISTNTTLLWLMLLFPRWAWKSEKQETSKHKPVLFSFFFLIKASVSWTLHDLAPFRCTVTTFFRANQRLLALKSSTREIPHYSLTRKPQTKLELSKLCDTHAGFIHWVHVLLFRGHESRTS